MAVYNEINVARYNRMLQKLMGMKGGPPARQLSSEIVPSLNLFLGCEARYLESWQRYAVAATAIAGGAGNRSAVMIRNPPGSNVIAVLEKIAVIGGAAADSPALNYVFTSAGNLPAATFAIVANTGLDNRFTPSPNSVVSLSSNAGGVLGVTVMQVATAISANADFLISDVHELPLAPGSAFIVYSNILNNAVEATFLWRERMLEDSERS